VGDSDHRENGANGHSNGHTTVNRRISTWEPPQIAEASFDEQNAAAGQILGALAQGKRTIALITFAVLGLVAAVTLASRMQFAISGSIYMGDLKSKTGMLDVVASQLDFGMGKGDITTEIEILKSHRLWKQAALASGLNTDLRPAGWSAPRYLSWRLSHRDLRTLAGAWPELRAVSTQLTGVAGTGQERDVEIKFKTPTEYDVIEAGNIVGHGALGKPVDITGLELTLIAGADSAPRAGSEYELEIDSLDDVLDSLDRHLNITAPKGTLPGTQADIVNIELTSNAPYKARMFLEELIHAYLEQNLDWKTEAAAAADKFLSKQLENVRASLDKAGRDLAEYKKQASTVDLGEEAKAMIGQIGTVEQQRVAARLEIDQLEHVKAVLAKGNVPTEAYLFGEAQDTVFIAMGQALVKAQADYKALAEQFTADYPPLKEAKAALDSQLQAVQSYVTTRLKREREQLTSLDSVMDKYSSELKQLPDTELKLVTLTQETEVYSKLYEFLLERQQQAALTKASTISENRVLDKPDIPSLEESPKLRVRGPLGLMLGLLLGVGFVLVRWRFSTTFQSESDVRKALPGLPLFASVPRLRDSKNRDRTGTTQPLDLLASDLRSPFAESFRLLRTNLYYSGSRERDKVIVVTSPGPGDGKTMTTLCIAGILASDGKRVLVIDGDMRKPSHHILLRQPQQPGLSGILTGEIRWTEAVRSVRTAFGEFDSITTGIAPPNAAELLSSPQLSQFLIEARATYDFILFDSPPFPLVSDALVLSHCGERVLSVLRVGVSDRRVTQEHMRRLIASTSHYGYVINDVSAGRGYGYAYGYGNGDTQAPAPGSPGKRRNRREPPNA
jgi:tyrosine-protein kinase Etk/Wzc